MTPDARASFEPPLAGTEVEHLLGALDRLRATFRWKAGHLDAAGLAARLPSSELSLGRLLKHLACVEDVCITVKLDGVGPGEPWRSADGDAQPDGDLVSADADTPEELYALWDGSVARSRARVADVLAADGLDRASVVADGGEHASLRRLLFDLVEEYGLLTGHADLLREAVDGLVGEDPPLDGPA